jgi:NADPH:quinone reductase-like Zn-dependent oxidoreductase
VQGISVGSTQMFEAMNRAIAANGIKPVIDKVFGFDEVQAAYKHMASGAHFGKIERALDEARAQQFKPFIREA